jgi:hypothetical protein
MAHNSQPQRGARGAARVELRTSPDPPRAFLQGMALQLRESLRVGKIAYSPHFFSLSMSRDEAKKRLGGEMRNFSVITEPSKSQFGKVRYARTCLCPSART